MCCIYCLFIYKIYICSTLYIHTSYNTYIHIIEHSTHKLSIAFPVIHIGERKGILSSRSLLRIKMSSNHPRLLPSQHLRCHSATVNGLDSVMACFTVWVGYQLAISALYIPTACDILRLFLFFDESQTVD